MVHGEFPEIKSLTTLDSNDITDQGVSGVITKKINVSDKFVFTVPLNNNAQRLVQFQQDEEVKAYIGYDDYGSTPQFQGYIPPNGISHNDFEMKVTTYGHLARLGNEYKYIGTRQTVDGTTEILNFEGWEMSSLAEDLVSSIDGSPLTTSGFHGTKPFQFVEETTDLGNGYVKKQTIINNLFQDMYDETSYPDPTKFYHLRESGGVAYLEKTPDLNGTASIKTITLGTDVTVGNIKFRQGFSSKAVGFIADGFFNEVTDVDRKARRGNYEIAVPSPGTGKLDDLQAKQIRELQRHKSGLVRVFDITLSGADFYWLNPWDVVYFSADKLGLTDYYMIAGVSIPYNRNGDIRLTLGNRGFLISEAL